jgi:hypothetical protein
MGVTARECRHSKHYEDIGLVCDKKRERINAVDADKPCPLCSEGDKEELGVVRKSRRSKYNSLNKCFLACGAPEEYCYVQKNPTKRHGTYHCGQASLYNKANGDFKGKRELLYDLKEFYMKTMKEIHPDINPYTERLYFDNESKEVNAAYQQGIRLIGYRIR